MAVHPDQGWSEFPLLRYPERRCSPDGARKLNAVSFQGIAKEEDTGWLEYFEKDAAMGRGKFDAPIGENDAHDVHIDDPPTPGCTDVAHR